MTDVLVRGVPDGVVAAIDERAQRLGLSRNEYLRRQLRRLATTGDTTVRVEDLDDFAATFADLGDPKVMRGAWG